MVVYTIERGAWLTRYCQVMPSTYRRGKKQRVVGADLGIAHMLDYLIAIKATLRALTAAVVAPVKPPKYEDVKQNANPARDLITGNNCLQD